MDSCVRFPIPEEQLEDLVVRAKDYALAHGILKRTEEDLRSQEVVTYCPFMLFPSPLPRHCFQAALDVQRDFNLLMHKVAHDYTFLKQCLQNSIEVDDFIRRLWGIYETVRGEGISQIPNYCTGDMLIFTGQRTVEPAVKPISLACNRSDYMLHQSQPTDPEDSGPFKIGDTSRISIKHVEFNTMASGMAGLCSKLTHLHRYILEVMGCDNIQDVIADNDSIGGLAEAFIEAWKAYGNKRAVALFLVADAEYNVYDQRSLEYAIHERNPHIKVIRRSLQMVGQKGTLDKDKSLHIDGYEVAVIYFRQMYTPTHYTCEQDWSTRLMVERSRAIKCPSIHYFLAGMKKVQQMLATPGVLERYLVDPAAIQRIRATFAGLYSLDLGDEGDRALAMAMADPDRFVVKPQREGGGNNVYGEEIRALLTGIKDSTERNAYILMERIFPVSYPNYALKPNQPVTLMQVVSELGIFGSLVGSADQVIHNGVRGYIHRTKSTDTHEGGISAGVGALDTPYLI